MLDDFLARRKGDRVGIVVFGSAPFVLVPFTTDLTLCRRMMAEMQAGMAGPRTAFGDAIGLGITLFANSAMKHKTMIALTDGNDTASQVPPAEAARIAHDRGITIDTVAIGDPAAVGEDKLDEAALRDVAQATGGGFYRAMDRAASPTSTGGSMRSRLARSTWSPRGRAPTCSGGRSRRCWC